MAKRKRPMRGGRCGELGNRPMEAGRGRCGVNWASAQVGLGGRCGLADSFFLISFSFLFKLTPFYLNSNEILIQT
jgi:hypothetical protein